MNIYPSDDPAFPTGRCDRCAREVLTYVELADDGTDVRRCVHCDHPVSETRLVAAADLDALGYALVEPRGCAGGCGGGTCRPNRPF